MPLLTLPGGLVFANRKSNPNAGWPTRGDDDNRVEPIAKPAFEAGFTLAPGERVYTIGSCFARNVEFWLEKRGFEVPVRQLINKPGLDLSHEGLLNNYGAPSIRNELEWAFDKARPFDPELNFQEINGRFVDLHMPMAVRPEPFDLVLRRRQAIIDSTRLISTCRVVIITLGLAEVWFDTRSGAYINEAPRLRLVDAEPERFQLHVLDVNDCVVHLERSMDLILRHGAPGVQVILTVSPVPMTVTMRPNADVMVANTYSKAVLRAAAETIVEGRDFVHYFPSYESIVLSDRTLAWRDDQIHVTPELVKLNVFRMLNAYGGAEPLKTADEVLEEARKLRTDINVEWAYLQDNKPVVADDGALAARYALVAMNRGDHDAAAWALDLMPRMVAPYQRELLLADLLLARGAFTDALAQADSVAAEPPLPRQQVGIDKGLHRIRTVAYLGLRDTAAAIDSAVRWANCGGSKRGVAIPFLTLARGFRDQGALAQAEHFFRQFLLATEEEAVVEIELAEVLVRLGRSAEAHAILDDLRVMTPTDERRARQVRAFAGPGTAEVAAR